MSSMLGIDPRFIAMVAFALSGAIGAVGGLVFGLATEGRSVFGPQALLEIEWEKAEVHIPTPVPALVQTGPGENPELACGVQLLDYRF